MSHVFCPVCEEGEIEVSVYTDSDGDGVWVHYFTQVEIESGCSEGCELTDADLDKVVEKAVDDYDRPW